MNYIILLTGTVLVTSVWTYSVQDENKLHADLLTGYNSNVRPADQVHISCNLNLQNLLYLDIVEQTLAVTGSLAVIWTDNRLSWNESENGIVSNIYFKSDQVWRPTLVLQNSAVGIEVIGDNGNQKSIPLTATSSGFIFWLAPAYFISFCSVDVSQFPFDTQTCELQISGWLYIMDSAKFVNLYDDINLDRFEQNGEYDVIRTYTRVDRYSLFSTYIEILIFGIELRRKYSYYVVNIVLPVFFMQVLGLVVFVVPTESGEKLTFSLTLLLSLAVMMTLVSEKIPTTSLQIPTLSIYMLGGAVISSLEVIMTVVILYFKHYQKEYVYVSWKIHCVLCLLTCKKRNKIESEIDVKVVESENHNSRTTVTVEDLAADGKINEEKFDISAVEGENFNEKGLVYEYRYTSEEISVMANTFSLVLFTIITLIFTLAMLVMVL